MRLKTPLPDDLRELLIDRLHYWQHELGLDDWRIEPSRSIAITSAMADVRCDVPARLASYRIGGGWGHQATPLMVDSTALHEVLHVLLAELTHVNWEQHPEDVRTAAEHRVVHTLERLLMSALLQSPEAYKRPPEV